MFKIKILSTRNKVELQFKLKNINYIKNIMAIRPVDLKQATGPAASIYEAIVVISKRARQINDQLRDDLNRRLADVINPNDDDNDIMNFDQLAISREFDRIPKPTFLALEEMLDGKLKFRYREVEKLNEDED